MGHCTRRDALKFVAAFSIFPEVELRGEIAMAEESSSTDTARLSASEQLMFATVRLEMPELDGRSGTGFFYSFYKQGNHQVPAIITNNHVIDGAQGVSFKLHRQSATGGRPEIESVIAFRVENLPARVVRHPTADLVAILIGDVLNQAEQGGDVPFTVSLDQSLIPTPDALHRLAPLETVLTVGYPGQLWDDRNNLPIFHRGSTATAPYIDFKGGKDFLVDFATWPGASGSPLFVFNEGGYTDSRTGSVILGASRVLLIGVVYGVAVQEVTGEVFIKSAPTTIGRTPLISSSAVPTNLGVCLRASQIIDLEQLLANFGIAPPPGYVVRSPI